MRQTATAIGIDIGGTNVRSALVSSRGDILDRHTESVARDPEHVLHRVAALCRQLDQPGSVGIGVGIPGRVDARNKIVLSGGYLDLGGIAFAQRLEKACGKPVVIDNDCNMALAAESTLGAAQGCRDVVMFTVGTGIGGAVMLDGIPVRGRATAGQLGHLTVSAATLPCRCGRLGCVETASSGTALARLVAEAGLPVGTSVDALFEWEADGDASARAVLDAWAVPLRDAIDSMVAAFDPEMVVLGGGLGGAARRALMRAPARSSWFQYPIVAARLGDDAGVIGAALSAMAEHAARAGPDVPDARRSFSGARP